jgi:Zn ribbon nucleic-acid-binding protein
MFLALESKPKYANCPHCQSTDTFISMSDDGRFCLNCNQKYDRADEIRLREQRMDEAHWAV